ncbi:reverse transcriptase [Caerostris extrusa]|uniref:Reverse transcriptase n=1 Tax=Caerostris extrusa TaxID=172846 RepID=A0AAV4PVS5_CAEEX|nr:reverse transcriptase [Caerostris extrusa]
MITDQLKKRIVPEVNDHFGLHPEDLVQKLDTYNNLRKQEPQADVKKFYPKQTRPVIACFDYAAVGWCHLWDESCKERNNKTKRQALTEKVIEEYESFYASPFVLISKLNGTHCLCINYRKLNSINVADCYPLTRMDGLLNEVKPTSFMSTTDLRTGYHQA